MQGVCRPKHKKVIEYNKIFITFLITFYKTNKLHVHTGSTYSMWTSHHHLLHSPRNSIRTALPPKNLALFYCGMFLHGSRVLDPWLCDCWSTWLVHDLLFSYDILLFLSLLACKKVKKTKFASFDALIDSLNKLK
jgi:hypothetical protein